MPDQENDFTIKCSNHVIEHQKFSTLGAACLAGELHIQVHKKCVVKVYQSTLHAIIRGEESNG